MLSKTRSFLFAAFAVVVAACQPAAAQQAPAGTMCGERAAVLERLERVYGEHPYIRALGTAGVIEVLGNTQTGTFTVIVTVPSGATCLVDAGEAFERLHPHLGDPT